VLEVDLFFGSQFDAPHICIPCQRLVMIEKQNCCTTHCRGKKEVFSESEVLFQRSGSGSALKVDVRLALLWRESDCCPVAIVHQVPSSVTNGLILP